MEVGASYRLDFQERKNEQVSLLERLRGYTKEECMGINSQEDAEDSFLRGATR